MNDILLKIIEKYAMATKKPGSSNEEVDKDKELIRRTQEQDDKFAMNELVRKYRNLITYSVQKAGLSYVMDASTAQQYAVAAFKDIIKNKIDLKRDNKPSTYLLASLPRTLEKKRYEFMDIGARKSSELTRKNQYVYTGQEFLKRELDREPTVDEIHAFCNERPGTQVTKAEIIRIKNLNRKEVSGNEQIGANSGGEFLTLQDIKNVDKISPEEVFNNLLLQQRIETVIQDKVNNYTKQERRFVRNYAGLGEFKNKPARSPLQAAANNGMTYYEARRVLEKTRKLLHME